MHTTHTLKHLAVLQHEGMNRFAFVSFKPTASKTSSLDIGYIPKKDGVLHVKLRDHTCFTCWNSRPCSADATSAEAAAHLFLANAVHSFAESQKQHYNGNQARSYGHSEKHQVWWQAAIQKLRCENTLPTNTLRVTGCSGRVNYTRKLVTRNA